MDSLSGLRVFWWGWRGMLNRPAWLARDVPFPGGRRRLVFEIGVGPLSVALISNLSPPAKDRE